jgi:hypothetical protein
VNRGIVLVAAANFVETLGSVRKAGHTDAETRLRRGRLRHIAVQLCHLREDDVAVVQVVLPFRGQLGAAAGALKQREAAFLLGNL